MPDVLIVGAGAAGVCAAHVLCDMGLQVAIVDAHASSAPCFKAEKLEPDQIELLKNCELLPYSVGALAALHQVVVYKGRSIVSSPRINQFGMHYDVFVNSLRQSLPDKIAQKVDIVTGLESQDGNPSARLRSGGTLTARLIIVATGTTDRLRTSCGATRRMIAAHHSIAFGFDVALERGQLPYDGVNFIPDNINELTGFLTLFPTPTGFRANMFAYQDPQSDWSREIRTDTVTALKRIFSGLPRVIGDFTVSGRVNGASIDLWTSDIAPVPGILMIGDSFQSVCPATGTGLSKVLTDVWVLKQLARDWFETPNMSVDKTRAYYNHPAKLMSDRRSLESALYGKKLAINRGLRYRLVRLRRDALGKIRTLKMGLSR